MAADATSLERFLASLVENVGPDQFVVEARVRMLWKECASQHGTVASAPSAGAASQASKPGSWADPYPAKLSSSMMRELRESFLASYPSEILNPESMPSARLMALVHKSVSEKNLKFPLWKHRLSASQEQAHQVSRPSKVPRLESLLFDDVPAKEVLSVLNHGYVSGILRLHATALALCKAAHLSVLKRYAQAFLKLCFPQLDSGFRGPSVAEAIKADEKAWEAINELYAHHDWELGDAVAEIIDFRMILHVFLQPRLAAPTPQLHGAGGKRPLGGNRLKGKGKSFMGKSLGKGKQSAVGRSDVVKISGAPHFSQAAMAPAPVSLAGSTSASSEAGPDYAGCLQHLSAHFSFSRQSVRSSVVGERAGYFNLGAMFGSGKVGLTHCSRTFQFSCIFLNQFLLSCFPQGEWTSVSVARSVQTRVHSDSGNLPGSKNFSVSLGDFTGGELWLAGEGCIPMRDMFGRIRYGRTVCTRHSPFSFSCDTMHATMPWHGGPRWALTAYSVPGVDVMSAAARSQLVELGFPLPGSPRAPAVPSPAVRSSPSGALPPPPPLPLPLRRNAVSAACRSISFGSPWQAISCSMKTLIVCCVLPAMVWLGLRMPHQFALNFSRIEDATDGGPKPIRTAAFPEGQPDLTAAEQQRLTASKLLLERCVALLDAVFSAGGHVSLAASQCP